MDNAPKNQAPADGKDEKKEIEDGKAMAIVAYIVAPVPYFAEKENKFVRFHAIQGMNIFIVAVGFLILSWIVNSIVADNCARSIVSGVGGGCGGFLVSFINLIFSLVGLGIVAISVMGIIYAAQGKKKELPIFDKIKFIKK